MFQLEAIRLCVFVVAVTDEVLGSGGKEGAWSRDKKGKVSGAKDETCTCCTWRWKSLAL